MVEIFTTTGCPYCQELKKELTINNVPFKEKDTSKREFFDEYNQLGVKAFPLTKIAQNNMITYIVGSDSEKITSLYELINANFRM